MLGDHKPRVVFHCIYKHCEDSRFLEDLNSTELLLKTDDPNKNYSFIAKKFLNVVNRQAPLKKEILRDISIPFMKKYILEAN